MGHPTHINPTVSSDLIAKSFISCWFWWVEALKTEVRQAYILFTTSTTLMHQIYVSNIFCASIDVLKAINEYFLYISQVFSPWNILSVYVSQLFFLFVFSVPDILVFHYILIRLTYCHLWGCASFYVSLLNPVVLMLLTCYIGWWQGWAGSSGRTGEARSSRPAWTHRPCRSQGGSRWRRARWLSGTLGSTGK